MNLEFEETKSPDLHSNHNENSTDSGNLLIIKSKSYHEDFPDSPVFKRFLSQPPKEKLPAPLNFLVLSIKNELIQMDLDMNRVEDIIQKLICNPGNQNKSKEVLLNDIFILYYDILEVEPSAPLFSSSPNFLIDIKSDIQNEILININNENLIDCEICYNPYDKTQSREFNQKMHSLCPQCYNDYLKDKINSSNVLDIKCPDSCGYIFKEEDIKEILLKDSNLYDRYVKFKKIVILNQDPNLRWCIKPGCNTFIKCSSNKSKVICPTCNFLMCFKCKGVWHDKITCEKALEEEFKMYEKKIGVKFCPKCKSRIEKNGGCNHMTCVQCKYQFCWICRRKYTTKHYLWWNLLGCPQMQNNAENRTMRSFYAKVFFLILFIILIPVWLAVFIILFVGFSIVTPSLLFVAYRKQEKWTKKDVLLCLLVEIGGLLILPIVMVLIIFPGFYLMKKEYNKRRGG